MLDSLKQKKNTKRIKMRIKTGDLVKVINGKEKGKTGEVLKTIPQENRVLVKGINLRTKHVKPTQEGENVSKIIKDFLKIKCPINKAAIILNKFFKKNRINLTVDQKYFPISYTY